MTPIAVNVDIDSPQEEVFAYVSDPSRFVQWQAGVVGGRMEDRTSSAVGSKYRTTRRIGGAEREVTSDITKLDPPANVQRLKERVEARASPSLA
jgi:uncharacterized protein YndB with AHSA1/START domain